MIITPKDPYGGIANKFHSYLIVLWPFANSESSAK